VYSVIPAQYPLKRTPAIPSLRDVQLYPQWRIISVMKNEFDISAMRQRLKSAVADKGRSMRSVSIDAGMGPGYLSSVLKEGKEPTVVSLSKICDELDVSFSYILYGMNLSPEAEQIIVLLDENPAKREGILALLSE
jgi:lambda repressor-like predicted transcriptional regulator